MRVTTWTLEMLAPPGRPPRELPDGARLESPTRMSPEYARFLYGVVGGDWYWIDRLSWTREQWVKELAATGTEFYVAYGEGVPLGYVHLQPQPGSGGGSDVEIRYFGLVRDAIGRGLGGALLEHGVAAAWTIHDRHDVAPVARVWVHTCSLDGPAALANYQARGFVVCSVDETDEQVPEEPVGAWASTGGR